MCPEGDEEAGVTRDRFEEERVAGRTVATAAPPNLPIFSLGGATAAGKAGFEAWRTLVSPVFVADLHERTDPSRFDIDFTAAHLGPLILGRTHSVSQRFARDAATVARSGVDHVIVQTYVGGSNHVTAEGESFEVGAGEVWFFDMARTVATETTPRFHNVSLTLPRALIEPLVSDVDALHGLKLDASRPTTGLLAQHLRTLADTMASMTAREAAAVVDATVHLVAGCAGVRTDAREMAGEAVSGALLARIRRGIDAHLGDPDLGPDLLCRLHGVSRARLYRLFEPIGGVADYIRRRRLRRAFLDLASPAERDTRVATIGYRWGFANEATFSRAFKTRFGLSPSEVRAGDGILLAAAGVPSDNLDGRLLEQWMRDLMER